MTSFYGKEGRRSSPLTWSSEGDGGEKVTHCRYVPYAFGIGLRKAIAEQNGIFCRAVYL